MVVEFIVQLATIITSLGVVIVAFKKYFINPLEKKIGDLSMSQCRNYLVDHMSDIKHGITMDAIQIARLYEVYDEYVRNGGNSYVHDEWENLKKLGKI